MLSLWRGRGQKYKFSRLSNEMSVLHIQTGVYGTWDVILQFDIKALSKLCLMGTNLAYKTPDSYCKTKFMI